MRRVAWGLTLAGVALSGFSAEDPVRAQTAPAAGSLPSVTVTAPDAAPKRARRSESSARPSTARRAQRSPVARPSSQQSVPGLSAGAGAMPGRGDVSSAVTALPAAVTVLDAPAISRLAVSTYGDLFRSLPGFNVSNYGQGAVGYGLSLRGYTDAEHGRDIAYFIDGVPLNEVSSLHTPNYADLNVLLPETIKSIDIVRGPFSVEAGDSNMGGSVYITTKQAEPFASIGVSGGTQGTARGVATYSTTQGAWLPYLALEGYHTDGYRDNSFVDRYNSFNKITTTLPDGATVSFRAQAYGTEYGAPGYANRDAIVAGAISERAATNKTDGGNKQLENFVTNYSSGALDQELKGTLFVSHQFSNRFADFGGGQRVQHEDRSMVGGRVSKVWTGAIGDDIPVQVLLGSNWRTDVIEAFQAPTIARAVSAPAVVNVGLTQTNVAGFGQVQVKPLPWLKFTAGSRYDQFYYDINDRITPGGTPNISNGVASPKVGVAITPVRWLELFANYGQGFRSIDVPAELIGNPGIQPFKIVSREGGFQFTFDRVRFFASYWTTDSANEAFQADAGLPVTFLGKAQRSGYDVDARWFVIQDPVNNVSLFANYTGVSARLVDAAPSYFVPNVPNYVANVGVDFNVATVNAQVLSGSAYVTFVGKKNLTQDGLITTSPYSRVTGKLAYSWPEGWTAFTQATWYPGDRLGEVAINFGNPVNASSADIFVSAQPTLAVLAGVTYRFPTVMAAAAPKLVTK
ncbi:outer membrane receptor protein involved in Fe transport [Bradyrhizobium japonicum]|uniref:TonB-dependent receptor n=1 Tax=Bradyrhizobium japonicum TaxID=375 RepID=UPI0012698EA4|nr:TonB-dependent receptor [Bradyrhizobium japonicum]MCW2216990.1 outer membrane receptor protein involved in Fe transport [Bradyrhizobium japonicum]MCW2341606.1 outer membrane receptor protein involved in Fe transport [Bradyrhizobium japonicum]